MRAETSSEPGLETVNAEADPPEVRGKPPTVGKRTTKAPTVSAGVSARMEDEGSSNTGSPVGDAHESTGTPRGAGRRVAERPVVPEKPGNAGGGKGREEGRRKGEGAMPNNRLHVRDPGSVTSEGTRSRGRGRRGVNRLGDGLESENRRKMGDGATPGSGKPAVFGNADNSSVGEGWRRGKSARPVRRAGTGNVATGAGLRPGAKATEPGP